MPKPAAADITIESLGGLGDGIGSLNGKPVFVPKSAPGDRLRVRIIHENRDGYQGVIDTILSAGPERATPPCPHFDRCGGCTLQQLTPAAYREFKTGILHHALIAAGFPMPEAQVAFLPAASRRRVEFKVTPDGTLGLLPLRSHVPVAITQCHVLEPELAALIEPLNSTPLDGIESVSLTAADSGVDVVLTLSPVGGGPGWGHDGHRHRLSRPPPNLPPGGGIIARICARLPDDAIQTIEQSAPVEMTLGGYAIPLPPDAFLQATREGQRLLTEAVTQAITPGSKVADLFCGIGTYGLPLSRVCDVLAVEGDAAMTVGLQQAVRQHAIPSLAVKQRDLFKQPLSSKELASFDAVVINPPRAGAKTQCEQLAASKAKTIVMVSCNPATFARDAKILARGGYRLQSALGIDQFTWSGHLEMVGVFGR